MRNKPLVHGKLCRSLKTKKTLFRERHRCSAGAPLLPLSYIVVNLVLNVSGLYLIRTVGALVTSLVSSLYVPMTIAVFALPLPYLVRSSALEIDIEITCLFVRGSGTPSHSKIYRGCHYTSGWTADLLV